MEYENICAWSVRNKLTISTSKTKEIIFHRPVSRNLDIPPPFPDNERVTMQHYSELISPPLVHLCTCRQNLMQINQRLYLLSQLKSQCMNVQVLQKLFTDVIMSKIRYALPAFADQLTADDRHRLGEISRKTLLRERERILFAK